MITVLLLVCATYIWVLFFTHVPFMVNRTFNAMPTERLQHHKSQLLQSLFQNFFNSEHSWQHELWFLNILDVQKFLVLHKFKFLGIGTIKCIQTDKSHVSTTLIFSLLKILFCQIYVEVTEIISLKKATSPTSHHVWIFLWICYTNILEFDVEILVNWMQSSTNA